MTRLSWQSLLVAIALILTGWTITSAPSDPIWLYPAMGLTFVAGGVVTFATILKN